MIYNAQVRAPALFLLLNALLFAQSPCEIPPGVIKPAGATIFTPEQEGWLGDVIAESMRQELRIYHRPTLIEPLERISARLAKYAPSGQYQFRFSLIELSDANAFALPGGRVYVSRRLIALAQNEDELAGVIAHEMGHVIARQSSLDVTKVLKRTLNVTSVGDRDDIFKKFNQVLDSAHRKVGGLTREEDDQLAADQLALRMVWMAGYDPHALPTFLDRISENKGAKGNFFSDLFGLTQPESKRLRVLIKSTEAIPQSCRSPHDATGQDTFREWQKTVAVLSAEDLTGGSSALDPKLRLDPRLRPELIGLRFSPDGRYLVAQDDSGINVLLREPFGFLFRIPALNAHHAVFNQNSTMVLFQAAGTRLEVWDIVKRSRVRLWEPRENRDCPDLIPSPDGRFAACIAFNQVRVLDLDANAELGHRTYTLDPFAILLSLLSANARHPVHGAFSPDGSAFLAGTSKTSGCCEPWAFDLHERSEMSIGKPLRGLIGGGFGFLAPDRIVVMNPHDIKQSGVFTWPDGKYVDKFTIPDFPFTPATKAPVLLIRPFKDYAVAAMDLQKKALFLVSFNPALDFYDSTDAAERRNGEVALYSDRNVKPFATLNLPQADLGHLRSAAHSPNFEWLAFSTKSRSEIWNLHTGRAAMYLPFDGGSISEKGVLTTTFERLEKGTENQGDKLVHIRASIDLNTSSEISSTKLPEKKEEGKSVQFAGRFEITLTTNLPKDKCTVQVKDTVSGRELWSREFEDPRQWYVGNALVFDFAGDGRGAERIFKQSPELREQAGSFHKREIASLLDVVALDTGAPLGRVLMENATVGFESVHVAGRTLFIEDSNGRTLAYSLDKGDRAGQQFGEVLAVDPARGLAAIENEPGTVVVFTPSMRKMAEFVFPGDVLYAGFDKAGERLLAVTRAQEVFIENLPGADAAH